MKNKGFTPTLILIVIVMAVGGYFMYQKGFLQKQPSKSLSSPTQNDIRTYRSEGGYFAIDLPSEMRRVEGKEEKKDDGTTGGEVWFTFEGELSNDAPSGLAVSYGKPGIEGKGGACVDEEGEGAYKTEVIAGQEVEVCEVGGFMAAYFVNPSREVEYSVHTERLNAEQVGVVSDAVRKTLRFE